MWQTQYEKAPNRPSSTGKSPTEEKTMDLLMNVLLILTVLAAALGSSYAALFHGLVKSERVLKWSNRKLAVGAVIVFLGVNAPWIAVLGYFIIT